MFSNYKEELKDIISELRSIKIVFSKDLIGILTNINHNLKGIKMTNEQVLAELVSIGSNLDEALTELSDVIAKQGQTSPEVDAALTKLKNASIALKDLVPNPPA